MADVAVVVYGHAAYVQTHVSRHDRLQRFLAARQRVVDRDRHGTQLPWRWPFGWEQLNGPAAFDGRGARARTNTQGGSTTAPGQHRGVGDRLSRMRRSISTRYGAIGVCSCPALQTLHSVLANRPRCVVALLAAFAPAVAPAVLGLLIAVSMPPAHAQINTRPTTVPIPPTEAEEIARLVKEKDLDGALKRADAFLVKNPRDLQMRFLRGVILTDQTKTAEAVAVFEALTEDFPELPEPYNNLAVLHAASGPARARACAIATGAHGAAGLRDRAREPRRRVRLDCRRRVPACDQAGSEQQDCPVQTRARARNQCQTARASVKTRPFRPRPFRPKYGET